MENKKVIITEAGQISAKNKGLLLKNGYLVIEVKDPSKIHFLSELEVSNPNDLLMSAIQGIVDTSSDAPKVAFVKELHKRMKAKENQEGKQIKR